MTARDLSQTQINFARISIICVDIIKLPLEDILNIFIKPTELKNKINACQSLLKGEFKLNPDQTKKCCIRSSSLPNYSKFDVTLLYKLIRNLCPSLGPTNKWGIQPTKNEVCVGDDIERIRYLRNTFFAHTESAEISNDDFQKLWDNAKCVINRCQKYTTNNGCTSDYIKMLNDLERQTLTFEEYTSRKKRSGAIYIAGDTDVICGETACLEADITLEEDVYLPVSWDKVDRLSRKQLDIKDDKYRGSNSSKLFIHCLSKKDEAGYQAVISRNHDVKIFSNEIYLRVLGEPPCLEELSVTSKNHEIVIHYVFEVLETSPIVKEIRWAKNELILDLSNEKYRGGRLEDHCITISSPGEDDKGVYTCKVLNAAGHDSKNVKLDIPGVEIPSKSKVIFGSETRFDCHVSGNPPPDKVEWQNSIDGTTFHPIDIDGDKHCGSSTDPLSSFLLVRNADFNDQQYYRIVVSNLIGKCISNTLFLQVTGNRPNMSEGTCTLLDHSVKLRCDVFLYDQSPALINVYWTKNGVKIDIANSNGKYSGVDMNDPSLTINNANRKDAGDYQLTAVNAVGETKSTVIVLGVPDVHLQKQENKEDGSMCFRVTIKSTPVPHFVQWSVKEEHSKTFQPINVSAAEYRGTSNSFPHPVLVLNHVKKIENCIFEIVVQNRIGEVKKEIPGEIDQDNLKICQRVVGKFYIDSGSRLPFANLFDGLAENFPKEKILQLKYLIRLSCNIEDDTELQNASSAADCFSILQKENIFTPSDVMAMQYLLQRTNCKELEKECVEFAKKRKALYYHEKSPENGYQNVRLHVVENVHNFNTEDETKIRETVANMVGCSIEDIRVNGYLPSTSFFLVLSIREIYIRRLFTIQQHNKDKLLKLKIDYFKDDSKTMHMGYTTGKDEHKTSTPSNELTSPKEDKDIKYHLNGEDDSLAPDTEKITTSKDAKRLQSSLNKYTNTYIDLQKESEELYSSMEEFVTTEGFRTHIKNEGCGLEKIEETLRLRRNDFRNTDCPIVIAGESCSGKSSIINLILGEKILPIGVTASTSLVYRIKPSEQYTVSTKNFRDEEIQKMSFENWKGIADKLEVLAKVDNKYISYVDICMPVPLLNGNAIIIDTPDFGDLEQKHVAEKMMTYLPNALAFVFVINAANTGGLQEHRLRTILSKMRSLCDMAGLTPKNVIFLLNKWDAISYKDDAQQEQFYKETKRTICKIWKKVNGSYIFKISTLKVSKERAKFTNYFSNFQNGLKTVITRNKNERMEVHLRILRDILHECNRIVSTKLACTITNAEKIAMHLKKIEETRDEVFSNIDKNISALFDEAYNGFQTYIHHPDFKTTVLQETDTFTESTIGQELNKCIENLGKAWQSEHFEDIFQKSIMEDLERKSENLQRSLYSSKGSLKVSFNLENRISTPVSLVERTRVAELLERFLINDIGSFTMSAPGFVTDGILSGKLQIGDFETVREKEFEARINAFTKEETQRTLRKKYSIRIKKIIQTGLERYFKESFIEIREYISKLKTNHDKYKPKRESLISLQSVLNQNLRRLQQIESMTPGKLKLKSKHPQK